MREGLGGSPLCYYIPEMLEVLPFIAAFGVCELYTRIGFNHPPSMVDIPLLWWHYHSIQIEFIISILACFKVHLPYEQQPMFR